MNKTPFVLSERQLELLFNITYYLTLCTYKTPLTPSEAARLLDIPANVAHYRTKRLFEVGLLEAAGEAGKGRYRSVAQTFHIPSELSHALGESSLLMLDGMLGKLHRANMAQAEKSFWDYEHPGTPLEFDLSGTINLRKAEQRSYPGVLNISSVNLSSQQYKRVTEAVRAILDDVTEEEGEKTCTLAFIAFDAPFMR